MRRLTLVERLRQREHEWNTGDQSDTSTALLREAADAIEALEKERDDFARGLVQERVNQVSFANLRAEVLAAIFPASVWAPPRGLSFTDDEARALRDLYERLSDNLSRTSQQGD